MTTTPHGQVPAIQRYKIGYHSDEWGVRSSTPGGIYDDVGQWVRYEDHADLVAAIRTQQPAPAAQQAVEVPTRKQGLQVAVWVLPDGKGGWKFSWDAQDERFWVRLSAPQPSPAAQAAESVLEDAARWQALPAFFEEYQIDAMKLYRDIDAYLDAARKQGANHD